MDLHEYQGKELFRRYGIPVSEGLLATSPAEARAAAEELGGPVVVKAQVLIGGRGKAGGIKLASTPDEAEARASEILGMDIRGHTVSKVWIEQASDIAREYYLSLTFDRSAKKPLFMFTTQGGIDIEEVAATSPDALVKLHVDPLEGCHPWHARRLVYQAGIDDPSEQKQIAAIVAKLYDAFVGADAMLCEINPLIVTPEGEVRALDSKFTVDDNALFRHPDIAEMRDVAGCRPARGARSREGRHVREARRRGRRSRKRRGADDVHGRRRDVRRRPARPTSATSAAAATRRASWTRSRSSRAIQQVRSIFFNIFGGITRCDEVARGILQAIEQMGLELPIVVRLDGTNAEEGRRILGRGRAREPPGRGHDARRGAPRGGAGRLMAILVDRDTRLVVQGLTGSEGRFHGLRNRSHGTNVVAGVTPGKGGQDVEGIPVFDTVAEAVVGDRREHGDGLRPAPFAADAMYEAIDAGHRDRDLHHGRGPRARDAPHPRVHPGSRRPADRPELPRRAVAGEGERRDHPGGDLP